MVEALKWRFNRGRRSNLSFFRDARGLECDLLMQGAGSLAAIEIKSGATPAGDWLDALKRVARGSLGSAPGPSSTAAPTTSAAAPETSFPSPASPTCSERQQTRHPLR